MLVTDEIYDLEAQVEDFRSSFPDVKAKYGESDKKTKAGAPPIPKKLDGEEI